MKIKTLLFFLLLAATFANGTCQHNTQISGSNNWWSCNWDRTYTCGGGAFCCCETGFAPNRDGYCADCGDHSGWVNTQYTRHNNRNCARSWAEVDMTPSDAEDYCDARDNCGGYQFSYYWHNGRRPQFFGKNTVVSDCPSNGRWTVWSKPRQCLTRMVGKRYIGGNPLLTGGTWVARNDNDDGEDCERQCEQNPRCNAWEFGSWHNRFYCANWEKTASGRWADSPNRLAAGECSKSIFVEGPMTGCEAGYTEPETSQKCAAIAREADIQYSWLFHRDYPPGCLYVTSERQIYFNQQSTGSTNRGDIRTVCVKNEACSSCRIRRNWNGMDEIEKRTYIDTVNIARRDEPYKSQYDALVISHGQLPFLEIHSDEQFFAWHRWFILEYENILRQITPCITVPYWAWEVAGDNWHQDEIWGPGDHQFGSCGHGPVNGPFSDMILPGTNDRLERHCFVGISLPKLTDFDGLFEQNDWAKFRNGMISRHDTVHGLIGGTMQDGATSGMAPEFFLHHNNVDRLWTRWQLKSQNHELAQPSRNGKLTGTFPTYTVDDFTRARNQAGTCVEYEDQIVHTSGRRRLGEKITKVNLAVAISNQLPKDDAFRNLLVHTNELSLQISEDFEARQLIFAANQRGDFLSDKRAHEIAHLHQENSDWGKYIRERKVDTEYVPDSKAKAFFTDIVGITAESARHALETTHKLEGLQTFDRQWAEFEQLFSEK